MKIFKKTAIAIFSILLFCAFTTAPEGEYVGNWKGEDKGDIGYLILDDEGYATFKFSGQTLGGKSYNHQGQKAAMRYVVDESKKPVQIDFIIQTNEKGEELGRLKGIIKMMGSNKMRMALGFGGADRPTDFETDAIVFKRTKE